MITDSHCHLASHRFPAEEIPELIERAKEAGVHRMITLATGEDDLQSNLTIAQEYPEVFCCLGIHPCDVHKARDNFEEVLTPLLSDPNVVAIGETGLDYFHPAPKGWTEEDYHARQRDFLKRHFEIAKATGKNIVIHTRDKTGHASFDDTLAIYNDYSDHVQAVFHCFPGPPELAARVISAGGLISFTGIATFKKAETVVATVQSVAPGTFMLETDSPYLAPTPHRGKRCEPGMTRHTAEAIAEQRQVTLEELAKETEAIVQNFFKF